MPNDAMRFCWWKARSRTPHYTVSKLVSLDRVIKLATHPLTRYEPNSFPNKLSPEVTHDCWILGVEPTWKPAQTDTGRLHVNQNDVGWQQGIWFCWTFNSAIDIGFGSKFPLNWLEFEKKERKSAIMNNRFKNNQAPSTFPSSWQTFRCFNGCPRYSSQCQ
jgi:hypothetical protein